MTCKSTFGKDKRPSVHQEQSFIIGFFGLFWTKISKQTTFFVPWSFIQYSQKNKKTHGVL